MYNHNVIEKKWQSEWEKRKVFKFKNIPTKKKFYVLDMFPYPSGSGLHLGHLKGYTASDVISRYKRLCGFNVLHPIGWDAFGLPAEQYAIETNNHPESFTIKNINYFREQLKSMGFDYDYDKEVNTSDPKYYVWTQWIFSKLFENGLAEIKMVDVNWCEQLKTVLSNEEVLEIDGKMVSERGHFPVIKKPLKQWVLKITKYAEKLLEGLDHIKWPDSLKTIQKKWIGKSVGSKIIFKTEKDVELEVFTTRADTIYGATFLALSPNNDLIDYLVDENKKRAVSSFIASQNLKVNSKRDEEINGVFLGCFAINPVSKKKIPIYVVNYVLDSYGSGAIMGVPAHDKRDYAFAKKNGIDIVHVIESNNDTVFELDGKHINSPLINGLFKKQAIEKINDYLKKNKIGDKKISYKLRDWVFSRQRYWGEPFPILFDENNHPILVKKLPVLLPKMTNFNERNENGTPLSNLKTWTHIKIGNKEFLRDTNTMPQWAGSCWYYLAYLMKNANGGYLPLNSQKAKSLFKRWMPIDLYIGGQEHAVLHLLYSRFWYRFLYDIKVVSQKEPFLKIINQGMVLGKDNEKMSKSRGNVINPNEIIKTHGADALRIYELFIGPIGASGMWNDVGLNGIRKWLDRVYRLFNLVNIKNKIINDKLEIHYHNFIKTITEDIESLSFNTAISKMMIFVNKCYETKEINKEYLKNFLVVLSSFAPHLAEELWHTALKEKKSISFSDWPKYDQTKINKTFITIPIQENGKLRATFNVPINLSEDEIIKKALSLEKVINFIKGRKIKKTIYIKNKIINFII